MRNKKYFGKEVAAMSGKTLFEKLGVKYIEKEGIFYPLITLGGEENVQMLENMVVCGWITYRGNIRSDTEVWYDLANYMIRRPR